MQTILWLALILFVGAVVENFDRYAGTGIRHAVFRAPATDLTGFIAGRDTKQRFWSMLVLFLLVCIPSVIFTSASILDIFYGFIVVPVLIIGSYGGPWLGRVWGRRDAFFAAVDKFQADPDAHIYGAWDALKDWFWNLVGSKPVAAAPVPAPQPVAPARDPLDQRPADEVVNEAPVAIVPPPPAAPGEKDFKDFVNS
jgi:hypothetical protein